MVNKETIIILGKFTTRDISHQQGQVKMYFPCFKILPNERKRVRTFWPNFDAWEVTKDLPQDFNQGSGNTKGTNFKIVYDEFDENIPSILKFKKIFLRINEIKISLKILF